MANSDRPFIDQQLAAALFRATCPPAADLQEHLFGFLSAGAQAEMRTHLARCPHCAREYAELAAFVPLEPEHPPTETVLERMQVAVARLFDGLSSVAAGAGVNVRGGADGPMVLQASVAQGALEISLQATSGDQGLTLLGMVNDSALEGWQVDLWQDGRLQDTETVDDLDSFEFKQVKPAQTQLIFRSESQLIATPLLPFTP